MVEDDAVGDASGGADHAWAGGGDHDGNWRGRLQPRQRGFGVGEPDSLPAREGAHCRDIGFDVSDLRLWQADGAQGRKPSADPHDRTPARQFGQRRHGACHHAGVARHRLRHAGRGLDSFRGHQDRRQGDRRDLAAQQLQSRSPIRCQNPSLPQ